MWFVAKAMASTPARASFMASDMKTAYQPFSSATCPSGHRSQRWHETTTHRGLRESKRKFAHGTRTAAQRWSLTLPPEAEGRALATAPERTKQPHDNALYALRAGSEGSLSQAVRRSGLRRARYVGLTKTQLQNGGPATAINLVRLLDWLTDASIGRTPHAAFANLLCPVQVTTR
jgi:transposase